ncbi:PepSY-associated TM helix domain-containing protein [Acinetobacter sp. VNH17]|uniref:PepSY-associated TM helix domain-containing protein n=1 Tax=Acinetobacter thutiue TaxID=2998078 RepID=A0ABT7WJP2_9GAMM|nr:PepSY-associated TM helix domain-containing protein [Acinetobacter thutiue]MCY6410799.1 PepSY-associated TM helix domain-containing protein [Acinetobacter thutiue]MDN0012901.1 PepSY-associated TM helix domain-containing protein [Acinetobacter thutiue]
MRTDGKNEGARQSMSWLHTWISLLLGWLLYAVFLTGTLSFFQNEITVWMKPELHQSINYTSQQQQLSYALQYLNEKGQKAESWNIRFANERQPAITLNIRKAGEGRRRGGEIYLDAATGQEIKARETRGGGFLYRFHFELYGMDRIWGRWIVGIATMFMFVAIISGIITHKKIFKDFFTFRPAKGQRSWLDAHNATAVFALPFHIMITFSGLLLLMYLFMPWSMKSNYGDGQAFYQVINEPVAKTPEQARLLAEQKRKEAQERGGRGERRGDDQAKKPELSPAPMVDILALNHSVQQQWKDNPIAYIRVNKPNTVESHIEFNATRTTTLLDRESIPTLKFNGVTGQVIDEAQPVNSIPKAIYTLVTWLHMAHGVDAVLRWLLFLSGVLGTMMVATGLILWTVKRAPDVQKLGYKPFGHRFVEVMNVAAIIGLPIACAAYFWSNRFISVQIAERSPIEIKVFFYTWLATLIYAIVRQHRQAWLELLALAAAMYLITPILNIATGGRALWSSIYHGQWMVASFDLICLILGMLFAYGYYKLKRYQGLPVKAKKVAKKEEQA